MNGPYREKLDMKQTLEMNNDEIIQACKLWLESRYGGLLKQDQDFEVKLIFYKNNLVENNIKVSAMVVQDR